MINNYGISIQCMILFFTLSLLSSITSVRSDSPSEVISLKNKTHITCVTNSKSPVFLDPPLPDNSTNYSPKLEFNLDSAEWKLVNSKKSNHGPITDKRWEDFKIEFKKHIEVSLHPESVVSLSIYEMLDINITFYIIYEEYMDFVNLCGNGTYWSYYSIKLKNRNMIFSRNNIPIKETTNLSPLRLIVESSSNIFFKIHNYDFYQSNRISIKPQKISINECMSLYTFLCSDCYLNILSTSNGTQHHIRGQEKWTEVIIEHGTYTIYKGRYDSKENGYWSIQPTRCIKRKNQTIIQEFPIVRNESQICRTLEDGREKIDSHTNELLKCNPGVLGNQCYLECTSLFGANKKHCDGYKIYIYGNYTCLWGYKGEFCDEECEQSQWGLNCMETCKDCECDSFSGKCKNTISREKEENPSFLPSKLSTQIFLDDKKETPKMHEGNAFLGVPIICFVSVMTILIPLVIILLYRKKVFLFIKTTNFFSLYNNSNQRETEERQELEALRDLEPHRSHHEELV